MKTLTALTLALSMVITTGFAQTKRIAHHSHSGSDTEFTTSASDNFGISPQMERQMDSTRKERKRVDDSVRVAHYRDSLNKAKTKRK